MSEQALKAQAERALAAERRAREAPTTVRSAAERAGGGDTMRVFRNSGAIQNVGGRSVGGRSPQG